MGGKHPCETIFLYRECVKSLNSPLCLTFDTPPFLYLSINICSQIGSKFLMTDLLAELIQCILNSTNRLVVYEIYVLENGECTNFANNYSKQTIRYFSIVPDDQELVCKL